MLSLQHINLINGNWDKAHFIAQTGWTAIKFCFNTHKRGTPIAFVTDRKAYVTVF
jgi:hypothetical protein